MISINLPPRQLAAITFVGVGTVVSVGVIACIAIVLSLLWLVVHLALLTVQAVIETLTTISSTYTASDPSIKFFFLLIIGYILYSVYLKVFKKEATK